MATPAPAPAAPQDNPAPLSSTTTHTTEPRPSTSDSRTLSTPHSLPPLTFHFKPKNPILYFIFLIICNVLIPCLLYYLLRIYVEHLTDKEIIGIASASLGLSSCFDAPFRLWNLTKKRDKFGPLGDGKWWHCDFTMWAYNWGMFWFAIPLAIAPAIPLYNFFLFSFAMLVSPIALLLLVSLHSFSNLPFPCSSDKARTPTKPAVFYIVEDIVAVDFGYGKEYRKEIHARYAASPVFRTMMWRQTLYWALSGGVFVGVTAAVNWGSPIGFAFGFVLGLFFIWGGLSGAISYLLVKSELKKERKWWEEKMINEKL